ncbi:MAG: M48 family metalloprotease [Bryobacteraceae bacterium]
MNLAVTCVLALAAIPLLKANPPMREPPSNPAVEHAFDEALRQSYEQLFATAAGLEFSKPQIERRRKFEGQAGGDCREKFKTLEKRFENRGSDLEKDLKRRTRSLSDTERSGIRCEILECRARRAQADHFQSTVIPNAYANRIAKLTLIEEWPAEELRIAEALRSGEYRNRRWADVKDIGFRGVGDGQEKDIKKGSEAIEEMRRNGMLPRTLTDSEVTSYVNGLAETIAAHSDLRAPVKVTLLDSPEVNAFALPGGFLFINRGLLEAVESDSQLAGVIAHEISHAAARHGHRLMRRATIASIFYQAAQVAALVFTGGAGIGTYYAMQYGFYGLGLVLSLDLLGVSRDFELEADQLGIQYAWNAGYDPRGFIQFFDRMATREGYIRGASWFRTHPPFYERMVHSEREIRFLPPREQWMVRTTAFDAMRDRLRTLPVPKGPPVPGRTHGKTPSLSAPSLDCPKPKLDYSDNDPLEKLCAPL